MTFFKLVAEDFKSTPNALLQQGFWALLFHRYGSSVRRIRIRILYIPLRIIHHILIKFSEVFFGIYLGPNAVIGRRFRISHFGAIIVHANAVIGDDVHIRQGVTIGNSGASKPNDVPTIGDRVDVGAGAKILGGIVVGDDVAIGANAVVIRDVPPGAIAVGVPAQIKFKNKSAATT